MSALAADRQRRRNAVPGRRCFRLLSAAEELNLLALIQVRNFESRIRPPLSHPFDVVSDSELVFRMRSRSDTDSKCGICSAKESFDPQKVAQIGMAPFVKRTSQTDSR